MINDAEHFLHAYLISTYLLWWSVYSYLLTFFKKLGCLCSLLNFEFFLFLHTSPLSGMLFENIFSQSVGYFSHSFSNIFCRANVFNLSILPNARSWRFSLIFPSRSFIVLYFTFQIANICWIIEKAREFQKNIYFCSIDYAKAFDCVDHNKLRKILKEMGIPDHLTCLLGNLYAGQEATVRTGHGTTDWLQIRKGVHQGCIMSHCLFNLYADYIMWNAKLDEAQAGIKTDGRNNNLR